MVMELVATHSSIIEKAIWRWFYVEFFGGLFFIAVGVFCFIARPSYAEVLMIFGCYIMLIFSRDRFMLKMDSYQVQHITQHMPPISKATMLLIFVPSIIGVTALFLSIRYHPGVWLPAVVVSGGIMGIIGNLLRMKHIPDMVKAMCDDPDYRKAW
jgi:hypothetical protein